MIYEGYFHNFQQVRKAYAENNLGIAASRYRPTGDLVCLLVGRSFTPDNEVCLTPFGVLHNFAPKCCKDTGAMPLIDTSGKITYQAKHLFEMLSADLRKQGAAMQFEDRSIFMFDDQGEPTIDAGVTITPTTQAYSIFLPSASPFEVFESPDNL